MIEVNHDMCDLCGTCVSVCPENAIEMFEQYLKIDKQVCTACRKCIRICPVQALTMDNEEDQT